MDRAYTEREIKTIREELVRLLEKYGPITDARDRIVDGQRRLEAIERHLGIKRKLAC